MDLVQLAVTVVTIGVVAGGILGVVSYLILLERKLSAWMQDRVGPNRLGPFGLIQPVADGLKMLLKEDIVPTHVDKFFYWLAPMVAAGTALLAFAVVPFGPTTAPPGPQPTPEAFAEAWAAYKAQPYQASIAPNVDIGILFTFAVTSLAVYGIILGGWSANNKYSLLGGLRSSAQLISYEIPLGMSILGVVLMTGSLNLERVIGWQAQHGWFVLYQPLGALLFTIGVFAESNRLPFDLPEAEQELVGGYHTEYSSLKFGLFFLGEYTHMITTSFMVMVVFFGGWHFPYLTDDSLWGPASLSSGMWWAGMLVKLAVLVAKACLMIVFYMLIRWTIPRFRFDQLMNLAWKTLIPLALANLVCVVLVLEFLPPARYPGSLWILTGASAVVFVASALFAAREATPRDVRVTDRPREMTAV